MGGIVPWGHHELIQQLRSKHATAVAELRSRLEAARKDERPALAAAIKQCEDELLHWERKLADCIF